MDTKSQNSNMLLAFLTLTGVIAIVALVGFFMLRKGPEIIQGQAEVTEYRVSSKVPGRILEFRVKEGQSVQAGDTLAGISKKAYGDFSHVEVISKTNDLENGNLIYVGQKLVLP